MRITFVCTGNTCRSVMAEALFKHMIKGTVLEDIEVDSAGTAASPNFTIFGELKEVFEENGMDVGNHVSKMINKEIMESSDYVLVMTSSHQEAISNRFPELRYKVKMLSEFAEDEIKDIEDPIGRGKRAYEKTFKVIKGYIEKIVERLKNEFEENR
ncbi:MAG: low molecular weight protein arginine phosphatase [Elusimicrobiota bacterium]